MMETIRYRLVDPYFHMHDTFQDLMPCTVHGSMIRALSSFFFR
ncbi:hypothetical protein NC653_035694 [Populus alba x Populus x berolinensis]|uniref:Uncharacterized protein n=1 Tax=Populus alba x Populus x berolinensis TaxID=444605 RepID=A0AAD6LIF1_9ROSI|nr:hypothetical protein NC653_035694 [Populus alba x Populus x berolinensis]